MILKLLSIVLLATIGKSTDYIDEFNYNIEPTPIKGCTVIYCNGLNCITGFLFNGEVATCINGETDGIIKCDDTVGYIVVNCFNKPIITTKTPNLNIKKYNNSLFIVILTFIGVITIIPTLILAIVVINHCTKNNPIIKRQPIIRQNLPSTNNSYIYTVPPPLFCTDECLTNRSVLNRLNHI